MFRMVVEEILSPTISQSGLLWAIVKFRFLHLVNIFLASSTPSLKALKQPSQIFWPKILTPYFFYSNIYLTFLRLCCENIFKIVCIVSEKIEKQISEFAILLLASIRSCLQFHWNRKYFSSAVLRLRGRLFMAPWHGFHLFDEER